MPIKENHAKTSPALQKLKLEPAAGCCRITNCFRKFSLLPVNFRFKRISQILLIKNVNLSSLTYSEFQCLLPVTVAFFSFSTFPNQPTKNSINFFVLFLYINFTFNIAFSFLSITTSRSVQHHVSLFYSIADFIQVRC